MAAGAIVLFDQFKKYLGDGTVDWDGLGTTLKLSLHNSGTTYTSSSMTTYSSTNELATANGYTNGGVTVASPTVTVAGTTTKYSGTVASPTWTASGGSIVARYGVIWVNATVNSVVNPAVGYFLLDSTPADVTTTATNTLTVTVPANGFFTLA